MFSFISNIFYKLRFHLKFNEKSKNSNFILAQRHLNLISQADETNKLMAQTPHQKNPTKPRKRENDNKQSLFI